MMTMMLQEDLCRCNVASLIGQKTNPSKLNELIIWKCISQGETEGCKSSAFSLKQGQSQLRDGNSLATLIATIKGDVRPLRQRINEGVDASGLNANGKEVRSQGETNHVLSFSFINFVKRMTIKQPPALACAAAPRDSQEAPRFVDFSQQNCVTETVYLYHVNQLAAFRHLVFLHQVMEEFCHIISSLIVFALLYICIIHYVAFLSRVVFCLMKR